MSILTLNVGSSSLKFALFEASRNTLERRLFGSIQDLDGQPRFEVNNTQGAMRSGERVMLAGPEQAVIFLLEWLRSNAQGIRITAVGHRVVHGGAAYSHPVRIDDGVLERLQAVTPLAPLHMPHNLAAIQALHARWSMVPQVACFDTAFHRTMPYHEQVYALPREWYDQGVCRYGFHGLSYEYIASVLPQHLGKQANGKVVVAHLGHGASLCAMQDRRSMATSMGFTPLDGIPMATRPGSLDPGIVLWLQREAGLSPDAVDDLLNQQSGLLGLSGVSSDMRELLQSNDPNAHQAIDYFVHHTARGIASLAGALGGLDALVFTAGIGENAPVIRDRICQQAAWLSIAMDAHANTQQQTCLSRPDSSVSVWRIPTDEERIIAAHTAGLTGAENP